MVINQSFRGLREGSNYNTVKEELEEQLKQQKEKEPTIDGEFEEC